MTNNSKRAYALFALKTVLCSTVFILSACGKPIEDEDVAPHEAAADRAAPTAETVAQEGLIDEGCVQTIVESNWHDDPALDMATILEISEGDMSQVSIDAVIDIALKADADCTR